MEPMSAVSAIGKLLALVNQLLGIREIRRKELYEELLRPTFESFQDVHHAYRTIFLTIRSGIDHLTAPGEQWFEPNAAELPVLEAALRGVRSAHTYESLIQQARTLREESHALRFSLRSGVASLLSIFNRPAERRYLLALALYFVDEGNVPNRPQELDHGMELLIKESSSSAIATPSMRLLWKLEGVKGDRDALKRVVDSALQELDKKYFLVTAAFTELKYSIINDISGAEMTFKKA